MLRRFEARVDESMPSADVPLLVLRLPEFGRIAWLHGRVRARILERQCVLAFARTGESALRDLDLLAHDNYSEDFLVALVSPKRHLEKMSTSEAYHAIVARLSAAFEAATGFPPLTGWTRWAKSANDPLERAVERALVRGAHERERYAFFSVIGHELRTPLTSIRGYLETVLRDELDDRARRHFLEVAEMEAARLGRLVEGLFDVSLLDLASTVQVEGSCRLASAIGSALVAVEARARLRGTTIEARAYPDVRLGMFEDRLVQVLINVLANAIEHGQVGVVTLSASMLGPDICEIRIDDDGSGIALDEQERIFELGYRGVGAVNSGTGIGLALARLLLERANGEIEASDSHLGGASFRIRLRAVGDDGVQSAL